MNPFIHLMGAWVIRFGQAKALVPEQQRAQEALQTLVQTQQTAMLNHQLTALRRLYTADGTAQEGLYTATRRSGYLKVWAQLHHIQWTGITVRVRTPLIRINDPSSVDFYAIEQKRYYFHDAEHPHRTEWFGIASRHYISIGERGGTWKITGDDFPNQVDAANAAGLSGLDQIGGHPPHGPWSVSRMRAVAYANQFCGDAPGCGNQQRYNPQYRNYNPIGGDCTNFISQVLFAGGLPMTRYWAYDSKNNQGSGAWVTAPGLVGFLRRSGHAQLVASGSYSFVTRHTATFPEGAVETLRPGDLISYQKGSAPITHSAVVVGYDAAGVPVIDTHTADRYRVPWDFGWPSHTVFYLWHVRYPGDANPGASERIPHRLIYQAPCLSMAGHLPPGK
jgi:hypothetical protein